MRVSDPVRVTVFRRRNIVSSKRSARRCEPRTSDRAGESCANSRAISRSSTAIRHWGQRNDWANADRHPPAASRTLVKVRPTSVTPVSDSSKSLPIKTFSAFRLG